MQILGSGGPRLNPFRSSSSYLLWLNGQARILVDMGGGAHHRFGQSQAKQLIVSHIGLFNLDAAIADLRKFYTGPLTVGADMQCTPVQ